jgi:hypothetical protein
MAVGNPISLTDNVASRIVSQIATESQTDFTISGGYRINAISVYRNGVRLVSGRDYSAADGSTVVLLSGASLSDVLEFHIFDDFRVADAIVSNASYQNIEGNLNIAGILTVTTLDLSSLTVSDSISIGGTLTYNDVTNVDSIGIITARTDLHVGAGLSVVGVSTLSGSVDLGSNGNLDTITATGRFDSDLVPSGDDARDIGSSSLEWRDLYIDGTGNIDTLVSGDGTFSTNLGIGTANPTNYGGAVKLALSSDGHTGLTIAAGTSSDSNIFFADGTAGDATHRGNIKYAHDGDSMRFHTAAEERLRITSDGNVGIGTDAPDAKLEVRDDSSQGIIVRSNSTQSTDTNKALRVRNNSDTNTFHVSHKGQGYFAGSVGIGTATVDSGKKLTVYGGVGIDGTHATQVTLDVDNKVGMDNTADSEQLILNLRGDVANNSQLVFKNYRLRNGTNWETSAFRIQRRVDATNMGYIDFGTGAGSAGRDMQFGSGNGTIYMHFDSSQGHVGIGLTDPTSNLHVFKSTSASSIIDAAAGDALLTLRNAGNTNWSGINFTRERNTGTNVIGGSIWMPSDTSNNGATLYLQTQSASANAGQSGALTDNNGVRLKLASQPGGVGADSAFSVEVGSTEKFRVAADGSVGIGSESPVTDVDISQKTGAVALPQGTTAQRPSGSSPYIRYNTTNSALEFYNGTSWVEIITDYFPTGSTILG